MNPTQFASQLGFLTARAKLAFENPKLEARYRFWSSLPKEMKDKLLKLGK